MKNKVKKAYVLINKKTGKFDVESLMRTKADAEFEECLYEPNTVEIKKVEVKVIN